MIRIAESFKRLTRSNPEYSAPIHPPNILTMAKKIANLSGVNFKNHQKSSSTGPINPISQFLKPK
jgi:hypothetical protein